MPMELHPLGGRYTGSTPVATAECLQDHTNIQWWRSLTVERVTRFITPRRQTLNQRPVIHKTGLQAA